MRIGRPSQETTIAVAEQPGIDVVDIWADWNMRAAKNTRKKAPKKCNNTSALEELTNQQLLSVKKIVFDQTILPVYDTIKTEHVQQLITLLTEKIRSQIEAEKSKLTEKFTSMLLPYIPGEVLDCWSIYPRLFEKHPGFLYKATEIPQITYSYWGTWETIPESFKYIWVQPNIPNYFNHGEEMELIAKNFTGKLGAADIYTINYNIMQNVLAYREVTIARQVLALQPFTYFQLYKYNPKWFTILYLYYDNLQRPNTK